jgi:hypothetical protein
MDTQTQIDRLIELAIIQRSELKQLVEQLPQLREHLNAEVERTFEEAEPQIRTELEEFVTRQAADKTATLGVALEAKIGELAKSLEESAQAKYSALIATRDQNATLLAQAEERIAAASAELPAKVKDIVAAELARFPRAGEIDQLRKEFAEPRGLNPRGKWQAGESYNKLDLVTINGDSYTSNTDNNITRPTRSSSDWTLVAARGAGGGGGPTSLSELTTVPSNGDILIGSGTSWVTSNLTAGAGISITVGAGEITISATDGDITLDDGTAASPSLHFTNDADTGLYRPAANTLGISVSGTQVAYFDTDGLTIPSAGVVAGGSFHGANGNANNPTFSFESDQDTGMYRHGTNELGFTIGGTEKAVMTSTTFTVTPNLVVSGTGSINGTSIPASKTLVVTTDKLSALASTSSSELAGVISDETGTGALVFANTPTLVTPNIGAATGTSVNLSGSGTFGGNLTVSGQIRAPYTADGSPGFSFSPANDIGISSFDGASLRFAVAGTRRFLMSSDSTLYGEGNASSLRLASTGFINLTAGGTNQNITLTPSGTGIVSVSGNLTVAGTTLTVGGAVGIVKSLASADLELQTTTAGTNVKIRPGAGTVATFAESGQTTLAGNLTVSGTGGFGNTVSITKAGGAILELNDSNQTARIRTVQTGVTHDLAFHVESAEKMRLFSTGNLFVGASPVDGGQKLQVSGNSGFLGHLEIPADKHIYMKQSNPLRWSSDGLSTGSVRADVYADSGGALYLRTNGSNTALTLDSSQRCILSGALRLANTYVATPQVSTGYVTIQDSTGTTYKVLVAT